MEKHYGEIIEKTMRRNGYSISEVARIMDVNRRSVYNWFEKPKLKETIIFKIGCALRHDFSREFPEFFSSDDFQEAFDSKRLPQLDASESTEKINYWKDKYISLLEQYNGMLSAQY